MILLNCCIGTTGQLRARRYRSDQPGGRLLSPCQPVSNGLAGVKLKIYRRKHEAARDEGLPTWHHSAGTSTNL